MEITTRNVTNYLLQSLTLFLEAPSTRDVISYPLLSPHSLLVSSLTDLVNTSSRCGGASPVGSVSRVYRTGDEGWVIGIYVSSLNLNQAARVLRGWAQSLP